MDIICAGILVADIFSRPLASLPKAGELKTTERFLLSAGGCAANTAASLRRLGQSVGVLGKVGRDPFGDFVVAELQRQGVVTSHIKRSSESHTSETFILNVRGEDRRYLHYIGANADFSLADIELEVLDPARVLYVGGYLAMPAFSANDLIGLFEQAKRKNLTTVLDVVVPANSDAAKEQFRAVLEHADYFLPNEDEARWITGLDDSLQQAKALAKLAPRCTSVVTRGPRGAILARAGEVVDVGGHPMEAIDGSGAGDAFAAGLITGLLQDWPLQDTLEFASAVGASCTRAVGCIDGVFTFEEAMSFLALQRQPQTG